MFKIVCSSRPFWIYRLSHVRYRSLSSFVRKNLCQREKAVTNFILLSPKKYKYTFWLLCSYDLGFSLWMKSGHAGLPRTTLLVYDLSQRVAKIPITPLYGNWIMFMGLFFVRSMIRKNGLKMSGEVGRTVPYYGACFTNGVEDWSKTSIMWSTMVKWLKSSILKKLLCFGMWHITNHLTKCTSNWLIITDREFLQYKSLIMNWV